MEKQMWSTTRPAYEILRFFMIGVSTSPIDYLKDCGVDNEYVENTTKEGLSFISVYFMGHQI